MAACGADSPAAATAPLGSYVLFSPNSQPNTYLMDLDGQLIHQWRSVYGPGLSVYLLPDGHLLRTNTPPLTNFSGLGANGGRVEELDWDGNVVWAYDYATPTVQQHHDVSAMPNGHVLMVAWEKRSGAGMMAAGRNASTIPPSGEVWVDHVIEVDPATNAIVWVWRLFDHLLPPGAAPADHPELVDPNFAATAAEDWTHVNAIDYNQRLDQVMLSVRNHSEIWIIDHSTTTEQAAAHSGGRSGRGGDLVFRWGNPRAYGTPGPQQLLFQHNAHWIGAGLPGAGEILLFDNGDRTVRPYSTAVQLAPSLDSNRYAFDPTAGFAPQAPDWIYTATPPQSLFAPIISSAQRLANGNTLVCDGPSGHFLEVTPTGETVWSYTVTDTRGTTPISTFRATRYESSYPGLAGRKLSPQGLLRVEPTS